MMKQYEVEVSVKCMAYNHVQYIKQCLDGFVMQKTNFVYEVIVHDDASTDGTDEIIKEYADKYPNIIKPIFETENQYSKHDDSLREIMNRHIRGKYVAICEGDDYWCDPLKLQKQYDLMEEHPEFSLCFHPFYRLRPEGFEPRKHVKRKKIYNIIDVLKNGLYVHPSAAFYRSCYLKEEGVPKFYDECPVGDVAMRYYYATKGDFGFIDEIMSVYRVFTPGSWTIGQRYNIRKKWKHLFCMLQVLDDYNIYTHGVYVNYIKKLKYERCMDFIKTVCSKIIKCRF